MKGSFCCASFALPGCTSEGDTRDDAIKNIRDAIKLDLESVGDNYAHLISAK
jgi:predicted RNase H-like HicB family nuclease